MLLNKETKPNLISDSPMLAIREKIPNSKSRPFSCGNSIFSSYVLKAHSIGQKLRCSKDSFVEYRFNRIYLQDNSCKKYKNKINGQNLWQGFQILYHFLC